MDKDKTLKKQHDDGEYYDQLYDLCCAVNKANMESFEGADPANIAKALRKHYDIFANLCMIEQQKYKVSERPAEKVVDKPINRNKKSTIRRDANGWGRCPACGGKMIRINKDSFLLNFPAYCKRCKAEFVVSWCDTSVIQY